jgi:hypothetical protein
VAGGQEAAVFYCKHARGVRDFALLDWPNSPAGCPSSLFCPRDRADTVSERRTWERKQRGDGSSLSKGLATTDLLLSCPADSRQRNTVRAGLTRVAPCVPASATGDDWWRTGEVAPARVARSPLSPLRLPFRVELIACIACYSAHDRVRRGGCDDAMRVRAGTHNDGTGGNV